MDPWICPRCGKVWAGWLAGCSCSPQTVSTSVGTTPVGVCKHESIIFDTLGMRCLICGHVFQAVPPVIISSIGVS